MLLLQESSGLEWIFFCMLNGFLVGGVALKAHDVFVSSVLRRLDQIYLLV